MTWLRDYIYFPLGGSRCKVWKIYRNIIIVWLLSGLWHGANWTFVCWGIYHALLLIIYRIYLKYKSDIHNYEDNKAIHFISIIITFAFVTVGWIFFRANSVSEALIFIHNMISNPMDWTNIISHLEGLGLTILVPSIGLLFIVELLNRNMNHGLQFAQTSYLSSCRVACYFVYIVLTMIIISFSDTQSEFIYFRF